MELLQFTMTGTAHSAGFKRFKDMIKAGDRLELQRDPTNAYDQGAIKVLYDGEHIGWVPKKLGEAKLMLDRLLEFDFQYIGVQTTVEMHETDNPVDMQLIVKVELFEFEAD